jgi:hypothetical protein
MANAITEIAPKSGITFTSVVIELLRQELAVMDYTIGIGREAGKIDSGENILEEGKNPRKTG